MNVKFDDKKIVFSNELRKIIQDLVNEENFTGEDIRPELPMKKFSFRKYKYL